MNTNNPHHIMPTYSPVPPWGSSHPGHGPFTISLPYPPPTWLIAPSPPPGALAPPAVQAPFLQPQLLVAWPLGGPAFPPGPLAWVPGWVLVPAAGQASPALPMTPPPPASPAKTHFKPPAASRVVFPGGSDQDEDRPLREEDCPAIEVWWANIDRWRHNDPQVLEAVSEEVDDEFIRTSLRKYLWPNCFGSKVVQAYVRQFFPDFSPDEVGGFEWMNDPSWLIWPEKALICQIMLDCCVVDPALDRSLPVAAGMELARELRCLRHFETVLVRHLGMKTRDVRAIKARASDILADAPRHGPSGPRH
jgi:hypothetical protein